jgi:DNA-binding NarL/FixJ family response regulator
MIRLILAEDHLMVRKGIAALLAKEPEMKIVGEAADGFEAAEMTEKLQPDVLLLDLSLPRLSGLSVIRRLALGPNSKTRILALTMHSDDLNVREALASGAQGYVLKESSPEELVTAVKTVVKGEPFVTPKLRRTVMDAVLRPKFSQTDPCSVLTSRERAVLEFAASGMTNAEVGRKLFISPRTVESHRANVMKKLHLANQTDLVRFAIREKIVPA